MKEAFAGKTQTMGPVTKKLNINADLIGSNGSLAIGLNQIINGREYAETMLNFELVKVLSFQVVGYPNDNLNNKPTYLNIDYFDSVDATNIGANDRTKIIYNDSKRPIFFNFRPMPIFKNGQKLNGWVPVRDLINLYSGIRFVAYTPDSNETINFRIVIRCVFRVPVVSKSTTFETRQTEEDLNKATKKIYEKRFNQDEIDKIFEEQKTKEKEKKEENKKRFLKIKINKINKKFDNLKSENCEGFSVISAPTYDEDEEEEEEDEKEENNKIVVKKAENNGAGEKLLGDVAAALRKLQVMIKSKPKEIKSIAEELIEKWNRRSNLIATVMNYECEDTEYVEALGPLIQPLFCKTVNTNLVMELSYKFLTFLGKMVNSKLEVVKHVNINFLLNEAKAYLQQEED